MKKLWVSDDLETARADLAEAQHAERQAEVRFAHGLIDYQDLRTAIRHVAYAELNVKACESYAEHRRKQ